MPYIDSVARTIAVQYNGVEFKSATRTQVQIRPVYDQSDRSIKYWVHTITIIGEVEPDTVLGDETSTKEVSDIIAKLSQPNQELTIQDNGIYNFSSLSADMNYGPKPRVLTWEPVGGRRVARIAWVVEWATTGCTTDTQDGRQELNAYLQGVTAFEYSSTYTVTKGITFRSIVGHIEIANPLQTTSAASYRDRLLSLFEIPPRFVRESYTATVSGDDRRLDFTVTDRAIESQNALPPYILEANVSHSLQNTRPYSNQQWTHNISGSLHVPLSVHNEWAWQMFRDIVMSRLEGMRRNPTQGDKPSALVMNISAHEEIFGKRHNFSVTVLQTRALLSFMSGVTGIFEDIGTSWEAHHQSMQLAGVNDPLGFHKLNRNYQSIHRICGSSEPTTTQDSYYVIGEPSRLSPTAPPNKEDPPKASSYIQYKSKMRGYRSTPNHKLIPLQDTSDQQDPDGKDASIDTGLLLGQQQGLKAKILKTGEPSFLVQMTGEAMRAKYDITPPTMVALNGMKCKEIDRDVEQGIFGYGEFITGEEVPIYAARWVITYEMDDPAAGQKVGIGPDHQLNYPGDPGIT